MNLPLQFYQPYYPNHKHSPNLQGEALNFWRQKSEQEQLARIDTVQIWCNKLQGWEI